MMMSNNLYFILIPKTIKAIKFIDANGPFYSLEKRYTQTFTRENQDFVLKLKSQRNGNELHVNAENDTDYRVMLDKSNKYKKTWTSL